jgi:hypothetical protein
MNETPPYELQQERVEIRRCRRCEGEGWESVDRSSNEAMGFALLAAFYGFCAFVLGFGICHYCG